MEANNHMSITIKNVMEDIVIHKIEELEASLDCCTCDKCKSDIAAYVLNRVTPKYVASEKGELFCRAMEHEEEHAFDLLKKIALAAYIIKNNPSHD